MDPITGAFLAISIGGILLGSLQWIWMIVVAADVLLALRFGLVIGGVIAIILTGIAIMVYKRKQVAVIPVTSAPPSS